MIVHCVAVLAANRLYDDVLPPDYWPHSQIVGGFSFNGSYPQIGRDAARAANWTANGGGGIVYHISGAFESAQCVTSKIDQATKTAVFDATQGCDQGPQLFQTSGAGLGWYAENIEEECDSAGEYYFGKSETGLPTLLFTFNGTEIPSGAEDFSLVTTKVLFNVSGSQAAPVKDITIRGLTIRDAALTFLGMTDADVHIPVSDSDWTIQRSGAVLIEGTEGFTFEGNLVTRVDGNGLKLSNYNRNASIVANEFSWIGDSAMSSLGSMGDCLYANCSAKLSYRGGGEFGHVNKGSSGVDGRGGNQPRHTRVAGNLVREVGLWQKQSSAWVQHLTAATQITGNVFMNGPHAMVSMNDGFGGADDVAGNLMMNSNRQTSVHGVINLWVRCSKSGPYPCCSCCSALLHVLLLQLLLLATVHSSCMALLLTGFTLEGARTVHQRPGPGPQLHKSAPCERLPQLLQGWERY